MRPMATRDFRNGCLCAEIFLRAQRRARARVWKFVHLMDHFGPLRYFKDFASNMVLSMCFGVQRWAYCNILGFENDKFNLYGMP